MKDAASSKAIAPNRAETCPKDMLSDSEISSLDLGPSVDNARHEMRNPAPPEVKITPPSEESDRSVAGRDGYNEDRVEDRAAAKYIDTPESERRTPRQKGRRVTAMFRTISTPLLSPLRTSTTGSGMRPSINRARTSFRKRHAE
ncbi:hypothetical protein BDV59DRAFT_168959 [Aspergillus ambiguus]|uniref:uncharacterized protein n=1 Tax=Aspergillus ambiguus TaxID=176160 RepID=UPI003CCCB2F0